MYTHLRDSSKLHGERRCYVEHVHLQAICSTSCWQYLDFFVQLRYSEFELGVVHLICSVLLLVPTHSGCVACLLPLEGLHLQ